MTRTLPIGLLTFALAFVGCQNGNVQKDVGTKKNIPKVSEEKKTIAQPDFQLTPEALVGELHADEAKATAKFQGKLLEITGVIHEIDVGSGDFRFKVSTGKEEKQVCEVLCGFITKDFDKAMRASAGQKVRVTGQFGRFTSALLTLEKCEFVALEPSKVQLAMAEAFTKEFEMDAMAAGQKYRGSNLIVKGTVEALDKTTSGFLVLKMKGTEKTALSIHMSHKLGLVREIVKKSDVVELRVYCRDVPELKNGEVTGLWGLLLGPKQSLAVDE